VVSLRVAPRESERHDPTDEEKCAEDELVQPVAAIDTGEEPQAQPRSNPGDATGRAHIRASWR